jgi:hypothetical protein
MYCWNCGTKNPNENRFCGQCGRSLLRPLDDTVAPVPVGMSAVTSSNAEKQTNPLVEEPRVVRETMRVETAAPARDITRNGSPSPTRVPASEPRRPVMSGYSGPSVLGLGSGTSNPDYLLDDDEDAERSSGRRLVAVLFLIMVGILAWKQWSVVKSSAQEYAAKAGIVTADAPRPSSAPPPLPPATVSSSERAAEAEMNPSPKISEPTSAEAEAESASVSKPEDDRGAEKAPKTAGEEPEIAAEEKSVGDDEETPAPKPQYDSRQVELAQKYLQGRGVPQDCARGVSLLRTAARQPNPKAHIQLGALYATGKCVTQDRAMAYRWFVQAQELEPNNSWLNRNLNNLWAGMTPSERRRAEEGFDRQD